MPYFVGGHPGFNCPLMEGESYEDYYLEFDEVETCTIPKQFPDTGLRLFNRKPFQSNQKTLDLNYDLFSADAITLDQLQSRSVALKSRKHDKGLRFDFEGFPISFYGQPLTRVRLLHQSHGVDYQPTEESDFFEDKKNVSLLTACGTRQHHFEITIQGQFERLALSRQPFKFRKNLQGGTPWICSPKNILEQPCFWLC